MTKFPSAYSSEQLSSYLDYISFPVHLRPAANPPLDISTLTALHTHHLAAVPYENLLLHYSRDHNVSIEPQDIYKKIVIDKRGRGGYCMENSIFFSNILRAFGFDAFPTGARIRLRTGGVPAGPYIGWSHIVNIVTLHPPFNSTSTNGISSPSTTTTTTTTEAQAAAAKEAPTRKYMVDISFGGDGATLPLPLTADLAHANLGTQEIRLTRGFLPEQTSASGEKSWIYQYRNGSDREWNSFYAFGEREWTEADFLAGNWWVSKVPGSFQLRQVLVIKFLRRDGGGGSMEEEVKDVEEARRRDGGIYGKRMMVDGLVKENLGGKTTVIRTCRTEGERVLALKELFGLTLTEEEVQGIRGLATEIKAEE